MQKRLFSNSCFFVLTPLGFVDEIYTMDSFWKCWVVNCFSNYDLKTTMTYFFKLHKKWMLVCRLSCRHPVARGRKSNNFQRKYCGITQGEIER
jgi:hypothetical protein